MTITAPTAARRAISTASTAFRTLEGDGFEVRRAIPGAGFEAIGPFIFLDHFGPIAVRPGEAKGASAHPHAGIETLTLLLEGRQTHKDSLGNVSSMRAGEAQWMRAGRGIVHDEGPDEVMRRDGGPLHGVQLWLNLPAGHKHDEPAYRHVRADEVPAITSPDGAVRARLFAGALGALAGPIETFGAPFVAQVTFERDGRVTLPAGASRELGAYVMTGAVRLTDDGPALGAGRIGRLTDGETLTLIGDAGTEVLLVGGDPLDAPIVRHGPFVMNRIDELERAVLDYHAGRMGRIAT
ncbi:pirin family protein [Caulobacter sp. KR2-114]|uniref:pirin family protein n=1 Tax=Caulobacter sp. KR2-114 TaxID=3400912 RepID=UPI003C0FDC43